MPHVGQDSAPVNCNTCLTSSLKANIWDFTVPEPQHRRSDVIVARYNKHAMRTYEYMWMGVGIIQEVTTRTLTSQPQSTWPRYKALHNTAATSLKLAVLSSNA